ncbi:acyltransferase family protein [Demequina sp.]|uniref:acyltransferase family protein n=1 Tax=Demequina sp. TaxID=2050685 RepID=UPI003D0CC700
MSVDAMVAATPATRDRYVDALRVLALAGVIMGHYLMAVVTWAPGENVGFTNILAVEPWTRWMTLVLQVMPLFFAVGGFSHAIAWRSTARRHGGYADFVAARVGRLIRPALVYVGVWMVLGLVIGLLWPEQSAPILQILGQLLWFIGIYLIAAAFAPALLRAHERWGWRALATLVAAAALVDVLRLTEVADGVKWLNFAFVWLAIHQLGFFYADGVHEKLGPKRLGAAMLATGTIAIVLLTTLGPYGISMVSYEGEQLSNLAPPTVVLLAFGVAQAGVALLARDWATRKLERPRTWKAVIVGGSMAMTAFLWHFTALVGVNGLWWWLGPDTSPAGGTAAWWWSKLYLLVPYLGLVAALVLVFRRFERFPTPEIAGPRLWRTLVAALGVACGIVGMIGFAAVGFRGIAELYTVTVVGVPLNSVAACALVVASALLTTLAVRRASVAP